jgi:hypothetical protein
MNTLNMPDEDYSQLLIDYDEGMKTSLIIKKYNLTIKLNQLGKHIEPLISDHKCPYCNTNLLLPKRKREIIGYKNTPYCSQCSHEDSVFCNCENCLEAKEQAAQKQWQARISQAFSLNKNLDQPFPFDSLSIEDQLWILSIILSMTAENFDRLSLISKRFPIYPDHTKTEEKIRHFIELGALQIVDVRASRENYRENIEITLQEMIFNLNITPSTETLYTMLQSDTGLSISPDEIAEIEKALLISEVYELIESNLSDIKAPFTPGDKTRVLINQLVNDYDYYCIAKILWSVSSKTLRYSMDHPCPKYQMYNRFINNLEGYLRNIKEKKWSITPSEYRPVKCPETAFRKLVNKFINNQI